jgi:hypothetical protein
MRLVTRRLPREAQLLWALLAAALVLGLWNAHAYPPGNGYDAVPHMQYADGLVPGGKLPQGTGEYYTPPGFYAVAGTADWLAAKAGLGEPHRATQLVNVLLVLLTAFLVYRIALLVFPGQARLALAAAAFTAFLPVTVKAEAMFHPEPLDLALSTLALYLVTRLLLRDGRTLALAGMLGATLGAAQLVRAFSLWTVAAVVLALLAGRRWRELAIVLVLAVLIPAPWYAHQRGTYGGSPVFNRPTAQKPIWERRPVSFYVDPGVPDVFTNPTRPHFLNRALPTTYTELWGDYFGVWSWQGHDLTAGAKRALQIQSVAGLVPTFVALVGWLAFLAGSLRRPARLAVAVLPALGVAGYLYFTVSYPTPDGDVLKATYMLTTLAGWAIGFGYALDRLRGRALWIVGALCAASFVVQVPFLVF